MFLPTTTNAADVMWLPTVDAMQSMGCDTLCVMRHAMDSAMCDEGTAFLLFFVGMLSWYRCSDGMLD